MIKLIGRFALISQIKSAEMFLILRPWSTTFSTSIDQLKRIISPQRNNSFKTFQTLPVARSNCLLRLTCYNVFVANSDRALESSSSFNRHYAKVNGYYPRVWELVAPGYTVGENSNPLLEQFQIKYRRFVQLKPLDADTKMADLIVLIMKVVVLQKNR